MNKLDRYDALQLQNAKKIIQSVSDYNCLPSSPLYKKLETVSKKLDIILSTETESEVQQEYLSHGFVKG